MAVFKDSLAAAVQAVLLGRGAVVEAVSANKDTEGMFLPVTNC